MAYNGSGAFSTIDTPVVTGTTISSTAFNATMADIATGLTDCVTRDGQSPALANLPMGGFKLTGLAAGSAATDSASIKDVQSGASTWAGTAGGTANALTLTPSPAIAAYAAGQRFRFKASASANTGATTVAISGLSAIAVQNSGSACAGGEITASGFYEITLDTTSTAQISPVGLAEIEAYMSAYGNSATATLATTATTATNQSGGTVAATTISASGLISANGGQIKFPATQNPSSDANTLDDYKEGSYVPTGTMSTSGTVTITGSTITYTKIGKRVFVSGFIFFNSVSSPLGDLVLSALPWASYGNSSFGVFSGGGGASGGPIEAYISNSANIALVKAAGGDFALFGPGDLVNNQQIYISGSYIAAN